MESENKNKSRREFLKTAGLGLLATSVASQILPKISLAAGAAAQSEEMKETDPLAISLGYVKDGSKADNKKFPKHAGPDGAKQNCFNCQFYLAKPTDKGDKAPCVIFNNKIVYAKGWCNSWTKKQGT